MDFPRVQDLHNLPEDARIDLIGHYVVAHGLRTGVVIDDEPEKVERYKRKLTERFPSLRILEELPGPVSGTVAIVVGPLVS